MGVLILETISSNSVYVNSYWHLNKIKQQKTALTLVKCAQRTLVSSLDSTNLEYHSLILVRNGTEKFVDSFKIQVIFRPHLEFVAHTFMNDKKRWNIL